MSTSLFFCSGTIVDFQTVLKHNTMSSPAWVSLPSWAVFYLCSLPRTEADNAASAKPVAKSEQQNNNKNNTKQPAAKNEQKSSSAASQDPDAQARDAFLARVEEIKKMGAQPVRNQIFGALHGAAHTAGGIQVNIHPQKNERDPHFFYWDFVDTTKRDEYYKKVNFDYTHYLDSHSHSTNADPHHYYWEFLKDADKTGATRDRKGSWTAASAQPNRERRGSVGLRGDARSAVVPTNNTNQ